MAVASTPGVGYEVYYDSLSQVQSGTRVLHFCHRSPAEELLGGPSEQVLAFLSLGHFSVSIDDQGMAEVGNGLLQAVQWLDSGADLESDEDLILP